MARITLLSTRFPDLLPARGRSPGVHVSDVIRGLCLRLGYFDEHRDLSTAWAQLGQAHEQAIINRLKRHYPRGRYVIPGERQCDGLYLTPDLLDLNPADYSDYEVAPTPTELAVIEEDGIAVEEVKLSWMSAKWVPSELYEGVEITDEGAEVGRLARPKYLEGAMVLVRELGGPSPAGFTGPDLVDGDDKLWRYLTQLKCYCWACRTRVGRLRVMHVNGFNDNNGPQPYVYQHLFDTLELAENWEFILSNARQYHGLGGGRVVVTVPELPPSASSFKIKGGR